MQRRVIFRGQSKPRWVTAHQYANCTETTVFPPSLPHTIWHGEYHPRPIARSFFHPSSHTGMRKLGLYCRVWASRADLRSVFQINGYDFWYMVLLYWNVLSPVHFVVQIFHYVGDCSIIGSPSMNETEIGVLRLLQPQASWRWTIWPFFHLCSKQRHLLFLVVIFPCFVLHLYLLVYHLRLPWGL